MTREEAIANLNMISVAFVEPVTKEQRKLIDDTFEMAIKALSQEPCDAISREDRLLDLANAIESDDSGYWTNKRISSALRNVSSVTQKSGKWIGYNYPAHECVYCSNCKTEYYEDDLYLGGSEFPKYCPNCGAKMESEDKEC